MKTPKFFELIGSSKENVDPQFRLYVELTDKDEDFWESQRLGTAEAAARMAALRKSLLEVLPTDTELSTVPVATFSDAHTDTIVANAEPVITKDGRRAWIARE
jgi:hypothetical protein